MGASSKDIVLNIYIIEYNKKSKVLQLTWNSDKVTLIDNVSFNQYWNFVHSKDLVQYFNKVLSRKNK